MRFLTLPFRNLARRRTRAFLTAAGVAAAIGSLIALVGTVRGLERGWTTKFARRGADVLVVRKGTVEILAATLDERLAAELKRVPGVVEVTEELLDLTDLENGEMVVLAGWAGNSPFWSGLHVLDGRLPAADESNTIIIGQATSDALGRKPGMTLALGGRELLVVGVFAQRDLLANWGVVMPLPALQALVEKQGRVTNFSLRLARSDQPFVSDVVETLRRRFPTLAFTETSEIGETNSVLRVIRATTWSISLIALAMAVVVIVNTLLMSVLERTREIGILRAVGWRSSSILALITTEGLMLTAIGTAAGTLLGFATLRWVMTASTLRGVLEADLSSRTVIEICLAALVLGTAGSLYPAWRALRLDPIQALRSE